jgi:hypothetical protein
MIDAIKATGIDRKRPTAKAQVVLSHSPHLTAVPRIYNIIAIGSRACRTAPETKT